MTTVPRHQGFAPIYNNFVIWLLSVAMAVFETKLILSVSNNIIL
jgi:hypothetical protein